MKVNDRQPRLQKEGRRSCFLPPLRNRFPIKRPGIIIYTSGNPIHNEYALPEPIKNRIRVKPTKYIYGKKGGKVVGIKICTSGNPFHNEYALSKP